MDKRFFSFFIGVSFVCFVDAQDIEVKKFELLDSNQTTVTNFRNDSNGNPCALLIIQSLKDGLEFEGWVVGDVERKDDAYWVYVANGAKHVKIKHADFQTKDVVFGEHGTVSLKGGQKYSLQLVDETKDIINKVYLLGWNLNDMEVPNNARTFLNMSATRGDVKAQIAMAQLSLEGEVKAIDGEVKHKGILWIKKLLAEGDSTCLDQMPGELMYAYAIQVMSDAYRSGEISMDRSLGRVDAVKELRAYTKICEYEIKACIKGFSQAGNDLFEDYPKSNGLPIYIKEVIRCCEDSAKIGNVKAMECLGLIYEKGIGINMDLSTAAEWFHRLYQTNHSSIALCRVYGNSQFPINESKLKFLQNQANEGNPEALYQLGLMYEEGRNVPINQEKAMELYNFNANTVHKGILFRKAILYCKRKEYDNAMKEAEKLLQEVHEPGIDLMNLECLRGIILYYKVESGNSYFQGRQEDGIAMLTSLAKQGHKEAKEFLNQIN